MSKIQELSYQLSDWYSKEQLSNYLLYNDVNRNPVIHMSHLSSRQYFESQSLHQQLQGAPKKTTCNMHMQIKTCMCDGRTFVAHSVI